VKCVLLDKEKNVLSSDINPVEDTLGKSFRVPEVPDSVENDAIYDMSKVELEKGGVTESRPISDKAEVAAPDIPDKLAVQNKKLKNVEKTCSTGFVIPELSFLDVLSRGMGESVIVQGLHDNKSPTTVKDVDVVKMLDSVVVEEVLDEGVVQVAPPVQEIVESKHHEMKEKCVEEI
jgi:hypothetical protein